MYIYDKTLGICYKFNTDHAGYEAARAQIRMIRSIGHEVGGDFGAVYQYFNGDVQSELISLQITRNSKADELNLAIFLYLW